MKERARLDSHAFAVAVSGLRMNDRVAAMARAVLVHGDTQGAVAKREGVTKQAVSKAARRVMRAALKLGPCPMCGRMQ